MSDDEHLRSPSVCTAAEIIGNERDDIFEDREQISHNNSNGVGLPYSTF